jgi:hypothetical protein
MSKFGPKNFDDPGERLFYESLLSSNLGDWTVKDFFKAKHEIKKYFLTEEHAIPIGVSKGRIQYKKETILILNVPDVPAYRMTLSNFEEVAAEISKYGIDVMAYILEKLVNQRNSEMTNTNQLSIDFTEPDYTKELAGLA